MENGITPVMNMGGNGFGAGGWEGLIFLFAILCLFGGGNFGGFGGGSQQFATRDQVQNGFDTQNMQMQTSGILSAVTDGTAQTIAASTANASNAINAIKDGNASLIREFGTVETALTALSGNMQNCCCSIKEQIMQSNYDGAMRDAATNANFTAQIQGVKDMISQNKIEALQAQVNRLELAQATSGIVRYPTTMSYDAGPFPPVFAAGV